MIIEYIKKHSFVKYIIFIILSVIYLYSLASVVFLPMEFTIDKPMALFFKTSPELIISLNDFDFNPFNIVISGLPLHIALLQVGGNIILLLPIGVLLPLFFKHLRSAKKVILIGFIVSCFIEFMQILENLLLSNEIMYLSKLVFGYYIVPEVMRSAETSDIMLNVIGVIMGYGMYKFIEYIYFRLRD